MIIFDEAAEINWPAILEYMEKRMKVYVVKFDGGRVSAVYRTEGMAEYHAAAMNKLFAYWRENWPDDPIKQKAISDHRLSEAYGLSYQPDRLPITPDKTFYYEEANLFEDLPPFVLNWEAMTK